MTKENTVRQVAKKEINWYGSVMVPAGAENVDVLARVENTRPLLLENSVLRVDVLIRLFVVLPEKGAQMETGTAGKKITKDIDVSSFIQLRNVRDFDQVVSVHHEIGVDRVSLRMGRVSTVGTLSLEVTYLGYVVLEGTVNEFPRGLAVPNAQVKVTDLDREQVLSSTTTNREGKYVFNELGPGTYRVLVEAEGFESDEQVAVVMLHDQVNFTLHRL